MFTQSRRSFIKGIAYSSALTVGGLSSVVMAKNSALEDQLELIKGSALPTCDISISRDQNIGSEVINLSNNTTDSITIKNISTAQLNDLNKHLVIEIKKLGKHVNQNAVTLASGGKLSIIVTAMCLEDCKSDLKQSPFIPNVLAGQLIVESDNPAYNGAIPLTVFELA